MHESITSYMHAVIAGYRIVSRKWCLANRIDRPDWQEYMNTKYPNIGDGDFYRRVLSKDRILVPESWRKQMLNSRHCHADRYIPMPWDNQGAKHVQDRSKGSQSNM